MTTSSEDCFAQKAQDRVAYWSVRMRSAHQAQSSFDNRCNVVTVRAVVDSFYSYYWAAWPAECKALWILLFKVLLSGSPMLNVSITMENTRMLWMLKIVQAWIDYGQLSNKDPKRR